MSLPDEIWTYVCTYAKSPFVLLQVNKRISTLVWNSITKVNYKYAPSNDQMRRMMSLVDLRTITFEHINIIPQLRITSLNINIPQNDAVLQVPLTVRILSVTNGPLLVLPDDITHLSLDKNLSYINLTPYTNLVQLELSKCPHVTGYILPQLSILSFNDHYPNPGDDMYPLMQNDIDIMTKLRVLKLVNNQTVRHLPNTIEELSLISCNIHDISNLTSLKKLVLAHDTNIGVIPLSVDEVFLDCAHVSSVVGLTNLQKLYITEYPHRDLPSGITSLAQLSTLVLRTHTINICNFPNLRVLGVSGDVDETQLLRMNLQELWMGNKCTISDDTLCQLTTLKKIIIRPHISLSGISTLTNLEYLQCWYNNMSDFTIFPKLKTLVMYVRQIMDITLPLSIKSVNVNTHTYYRPQLRRIGDAYVYKK